jgi:hypothetical protein
MKSWFAALLLFASVLSATPAPRPYPILFVTQPPFPGDFTSFNAVFGNHHPDLQSSNRGGDLCPVTITRVPHQPANYNNVSPIYDTNGRILFTSDRPRDGSPQLYPSSTSTSPSQR